MLYSDRFNAWKARWDGQEPGTMPAADDPDPIERIRYAQIFENYEYN